MAHSFLRVCVQKKMSPGGGSRLNLRPPSVVVPLTSRGRVSVKQQEKGNRQQLKTTLRTGEPVVSFMVSRWQETRGHYAFRSASVEVTTSSCLFCYFCIKRSNVWHEPITTPAGSRITAHTDSKERWNPAIKSSSNKLEKMNTLLLWHVRRVYIRMLSVPLKLSGS